MRIANCPSRQGTGSRPGTEPWRRAIAILLVGLSSCLLPPRYAEPPPPRPAPAPAPVPPPAPAAREVLPEEEAVGVAMRYVRAQGLSASEVRRAHLDGAGRWHIELRGDRGRDKAKVLVDGWSGRVLRAKLRDTDRDWDDE
jgi:hypothetical protein